MNKMKISKKVENVKRNSGTECTITEMTSLLEGLKGRCEQIELVN